MICAQTSKCNVANNIKSRDNLLSNTRVDENKLRMQTSWLEMFSTHSKVNQSDYFIAHRNHGMWSSGAHENYWMSHLIGLILSLSSEISFNAIKFWVNPQ